MFDRILKRFGLMTIGRAKLIGTRLVMAHGRAQEKYVEEDFGVKGGNTRAELQTWAEESFDKCVKENGFDFKMLMEKKTV